MEKENKINQLRAMGVIKGNSNLNVTYNDLKNENYDLRNILNQYKAQYSNTNQNVVVKLLGGDLSIKWDEYVYMTDPAKFVYEGVYYD